jgi:hypothetical protein
MGWGMENNNGFGYDIGGVVSDFGNNNNNIG